MFFPFPCAVEYDIFSIKYSKDLYFRPCKSKKTNYFYDKEGKIGMNRIGQIVGMWICLGLLVLALGAAGALAKYLYSLGAVPCLLIGIPLVLFACYAAIRIIAK